MKVIRKPNRLHPNLYKGGYWYFVTICTFGREEILSEIISENVKTYLWQKSFHDRINRNQKEYDILTQYIHDNPMLWDQDSLNPVNDGIEDTKTK